MNSIPLWIAQTLASAFLAVLFLQSGLDKVLDWKGNKDYIAGFFAKTPLRKFSTVMLLQITLLEVLAGVVSAAGCLTVLVTRTSAIAFAGAVLSGIAIVALFFGQRIAKDYAAAAGMVPYAIFAIGSVLVQGANL
jgi:uncharacterized membrane protein YphA (DoxX/SURF4 family)